MLILTLGTQTWQNFLAILEAYPEALFRKLSRAERGNEIDFFDQTKMHKVLKNKQLICSFWDQSSIYNYPNSLVTGFHRTFVIKILKKSVFLRMLCDACRFWQTILSHFLESSLCKIGNFWDFFETAVLRTAGSFGTVNPPTLTSIEQTCWRQVKGRWGD